MLTLKFAGDSFLASSQLLVGSRQSLAFLGGQRIIPSVCHHTVFSLCICVITWTSFLRTLTSELAATLLE